VIKCSKVKGSDNVAEKRNDIIEEQRRARQEFLKLKQMQNGEIEPEAKPSEIAIKPTTFSEKWQNFWYHYKVQTIIAVFLIAVISFITVQSLTREKYDISIMYFAYSPAAPAQIERAQSYFEQYAEDVNGDGKVKVKLIDCSFNSELRDMQYRHASLSKVQSILAVESETVLYLTDKQAREYFDNAFDIEIFTSDLIPMNDTFYKQTAKEDLIFPKELQLGLRVLKGTTFEGDKKAEKAFANAQKLYDKVRNSK
jgi:hypothetical protein